MTSILKVDELQDTSGNLIIKEDSNTITIGASGDTTNIIGTLNKDGVAVANTPAFFARCSTQQSISNTTVTKIQFDTEIYDTDSAYDNSSNYRFTPGVAGKYNFTMTVSLDDVGDQKNFYLYIYKNGSQTGVATTRVRGSGTEKMTSFCHWSDIANTTDYYEGFVYHDIGSTQVLRPDLATTFLGYKIIE